jgi:hypothetical protein
MQNAIRQALITGGTTLTSPSGTQHLGAGNTGAAAARRDTAALTQAHELLAGADLSGVDLDTVDVTELLSELNALLGNASTSTKAEPEPPPVIAGTVDAQGNKLSLGEALANSFVPGAFGETEPLPEEKTPESEEDEEIDLDKIDLTELTARIYDRLRSRLRLELLVDRERAGLLTDFR